MRAGRLEGWELSPGPPAVRGWGKGRNREEDMNEAGRTPPKGTVSWSLEGGMISCPPGRQGRELSPGFGNEEAAGGLAEQSSARAGALCGAEWDPSFQVRAVPPAAA